VLEPSGRLRFVTYDADGRIDQDLACLNCAYNLRTLHDDADCPECGQSVYESAKRARLCQHDPIWLRRLTEAANWIAVAFGCFVLLVSAALIMGALQADSDVVLFLVVIPIIGIVVGPIGFWKITAPHHCRGIRWVRVRALARWMVAAGFIWFLLVIIAGSMLSLEPSDEPVLWLIRCCLVCLGVAVWATHTYVAGLAAKMPEAKLAKYTRFVGSGFVLCLALDLVMTISPVEALWQLSMAGLYALSIGSIALSIGYRRGFRQALTKSQQGAEGQAPECGHDAEQERQFRQSQRRAKAKSAVPTQPYKPKRRRWPWVLLALVLVMAGTLGIVRYTLHRRVAVKLAQLRAEGYPTTLSELDAWYVMPSGANAADAYLKAFNAYVKDDELEALLPGSMANRVQWPAPDEPMPAEMLAAAESLLAQNTEAIARLYEAALIRECRYPIDLTKGIEVDLPHLTELRWGTRLLLCRANLEARRGNGDQVVEAVAALLAASNSLAMEPEHISQIVRVAIQSEGCRTVERLLSGDEWTDVQLARLSQAFAGAIDRRALPRAMAGLRAILLDASDIFDTADGKIVFFRLLGGL
jgi:hypothetical protein